MPQSALSSSARHGNLICLMFGVACGLGWLRSHAERPTLTDSDVAGLRARLNRAKSSNETGLLRARLLDGSNVAIRRTLETDDDLGLALSAHWRRVRRRVDPTLYFGAPPEDGESVASLCRFLESRTAISAPNWWQTAFVNRGLGTPPGQEFRKAKNTISSPSDSIDRISVPVDAVLSKDGDSLVIAVGTKVLKINPDVSKHLLSDGNSEWLVQFDKDVCYVVPIGLSFSHIYCFDSVTGNQLWNAEHWGLGIENLGPISGAWWHSVDLYLDANRLVVFGTGPRAGYIEAFDRDNGACEFRFSSNNWFAAERSAQGDDHEHSRWQAR